MDCSAHVTPFEKETGFRKTFGVEVGEMAPDVGMWPHGGVRRVGFHPAKALSPESFFLARRCPLRVLASHLANRHPPASIFTLPIEQDVGGRDANLL